LQRRPSFTGKVPTLSLSAVNGYFAEHHVVVLTLNHVVLGSIWDYFSRVEDFVHHLREMLIGAKVLVVELGVPGRVNPAEVLHTIEFSDCLGDQITELQLRALLNRL